MSFVKTSAQTVSVVLSNGAVIEAEAVWSPAEIARGLKYRDGLDPNTGMLLIFPLPSFHPLTMTDVSFPLDLVWLDRQKRIVELRSGAKPGETKIGGNRVSKYALELPALTIEASGLKVGQTVHVGGLNG